MQVIDVTAELVDDAVIASYKVVGEHSVSAIKQVLRPIWLAEFIEETEMNDSEKYTTLYLVRNLLKVVERYLEFKFLVV